MTAVLTRKGKAMADPRRSPLTRLALVAAFLAPLALGLWQKADVAGRKVAGVPLVVK